MFDFANPVLLFFLLPTAVAAWFVYRKRTFSGLLFAATSRLPAQVSTWRLRLAQILPAIFVTGLIMLVVAMAGPRTVFSRIRQETNSIAIEMVVDISGSMDALDLSRKTSTGIEYRTRLDVVKEKFSEFVDQRPDDLIGLVTFGGYASTRVPLTTDHNILQHVLKGVEIPKPGVDDKGQVINSEELLTAIGDALATACARIRTAEPESKIIVLLSDGESNTGIIKPLQAVDAAKQLGIKVYTLGIGSKDGYAPIANGRDFMGRPIISKQKVSLDEQLLKQIADTTGGMYFHVSDPSGLEKAMQAIDKLEKTQIENDIYEQYRELYIWFLFPALVLILLSAGMNMLIIRRII